MYDYYDMRSSPKRMSAKDVLWNLVWLQKSSFNLLNTVFHREIAGNFRKYKIDSI